MRRALICLLAVVLAGCGARAHAARAPRQVSLGVGSPALVGTLTLPAGRGPFPAVVLVAGSGPQDQDETLGPNHPLLDIAMGLAARGIATLRYDKRTRDYPSSIDPATFTPQQEYVPDALAAVRLLQTRPEIDRREIYVLGHSQGGTYVPLIAARAPQIRGVIMLAAAIEPLGRALLRQVSYLATLGGAIGAGAQEQLPGVRARSGLLDDVAALARLKPAAPLFDGAGAPYFSAAARYNAMAAVRAMRQPALLLQGDRDYQVTVADDLDVWRRALRGRSDVTVARFPAADHLLLDGSGPATPAEYQQAGVVDPGVAAAIADWIELIDR